MRISLSILAVLAMSACSNGSSSSSGIATAGDSGLSFAGFTNLNEVVATEDGAAFIAASEALNTAASDIDGRTLESFNFTRFDTVPTAGTASYSGMMNVNAGEDANLAAGLGLDVNFATNVIDAEQTTQFYANDDGTLIAYEGELALEGLLRERENSPANRVTLDVDGTLIGDGNTIVVNGEVLGKLVGTPVVGISANTSIADALDNASSDGEIVNADRLLTITRNDVALEDGSVGFVVVADPVAAETD